MELRKNHVGLWGLFRLCNKLKQEMIKNQKGIQRTKCVVAV